jgi:hypothetical protein
MVIHYNAGRFLEINRRFLDIFLFKAVGPHSLIVLFYGTKFSPASLLAPATMPAA